jgi:NitT/TauT family transport system substrate-binding protein
MSAGTTTTGAVTMITSVRERRSHLVVVTLALLALVAAACGGAEQPGGSAGDASPADGAPAQQASPAADPSAAGDLVPVRVGDILGIPSAFLQYAVQEGFMEEEGLDVEVVANPGGAANIPGVEAGEFQIAGSNAVSVLLARAQGLPVKMVSAGTFAAEQPDDDFSQILVTADSPIQGPADLDGRSVAVNTLANIAEVTIRASLDNAGATHENIDFVEMGFPDMIPELQAGRIDAVHVIEPFLSIGLEEGLRPIIAPYAGTEPGMAIGSYFSSDAYIAEHPEVIDRFIAGVTAAGDAIAEDPDAFREALVDLADLDPQVADAVKLPDWGGPIDTRSVELIGELMVRYELFDQAPPIEDVVYQP